MRTLIFAKRCVKEIMRDPMSLVFGIGFPVIILALLSIVNGRIPAEAHMTLFEPESLFPAVAVFGLSFLTLFSGLLIAKDRTSSFFTRLFASPMKSADFIFGYSAALIPVAVIQVAVTLFAAAAFGLKVGAGAVYACLSLIPSGIFFISVGLIIGSVFSDKAVGGISSILVNLTAWLSGAWFDLKLLGGAFEKICGFLPFANAVDAGRMLTAGNYSGAVKPLITVCVYVVLSAAAAVAVFAVRTSRNK